MCVWCVVCGVEWCVYVCGFWCNDVTRAAIPGTAATAEEKFGVTVMVVRDCCG